MKNEFIPYQQALELKELGFDEPCFGKIYADGGSEQLSYPYKNSDQIGKVTSCSAPLYQQVFRWFREKYYIHSWIVNAEDNHNSFKPFFRGKNIHSQHLIDFYKTYEEAELARLNKLIKIVKKQKMLNDGRTI
jgi:hypothetical protein